MAGTITNELGSIIIPEDVIATIAGLAATENYGIVGMSAKTAGDQLWQIIGGDNQKRGVKVTVLEEENVVDIDLYVMVMYGSSMSAVASNAISNVRYSVKNLTGLTVRNVNVHVEGIKA